MLTLAKMLSDLIGADPEPTQAGLAAAIVAADAEVNDLLDQGKRGVGPRSSDSPEWRRLHAAAYADWAYERYEEAWKRLEAAHGGDPKPSAAEVVLVLQWTLYDLRSVIAHWSSVAKDPF